MLRRAVGIDVLTTFADVQSISTQDKNTTTTTDDLLKVERTVYNNLGVSQNLFNTDGNLSLEKSILNDESYILVLPSYSKPSIAYSNCFALPLSYVSLSINLQKSYF